MPSPMNGPLEGLRVLELASGVAGPYAGRLFAMLGADVVKVEPAGGDPARTLPVDRGPERDPSPVFVHLNGGKRIVRESPGPRWAHLVLDDHLRAALPDAADALLVSVTAWGIDADDAGHPLDEYRVQAASGMMAVNGDDGHDPVRFPGYQSQYLAGAYAAAAALAGLANGARHVEITWVAAALTGVEGAASTALHRTANEEVDPKTAGLQSSTYPAGALACADGHVVPGTVRPVDWTLQCAVYDRPDLLTDERFDWRGRWVNRDALWAEIEPWYRAHTKRQIFQRALDVGWAVGMVLKPSDALDDDHLGARHFLGTVNGATKPAPIASRPWRAEGIAEGHNVALAAPVDRIPSSANASAPADAPRPPSLDAIKVLELTWAWAGPFVGRFLGGLGADVVRIETGAHPDGWRTPLKVDGVLTWDAAPLHNGLNRNKRSASVDLSHPEGRDVLVALLEQADVFVVNMTASVLSDRGVEDDVLRAVDRGLVAITMPSLGNTGPYRTMPGYGMLIEGMGGLAARFGRPEEGARTTTTYYPDAIAGIHGTVAVLTGLAQRSTTGRGTLIDLSQQETTWLHLGEGLVLARRDGRDPERLGNNEAGCPAPDAVLTSFGDLPAARVERIDHPITGERRYVASPLVIDGEPVRSTRRAPLFGEHTDDALRGWLGLDGTRLQDLRATSAIGSVPQPRAR